MCSVNSLTQQVFKLTQPEADHHMGTMSPPLYKQLVGSLMFQMLEKTQESSLFLLSYLKTVSTGPDGNWTCDRQRDSFCWISSPVRTFKVLCKLQGFIVVYLLNCGMTLQEVLCYWHQLTWEEKLDNYTKTGPQIISLSRQQARQEFNEFFNCIITTWCPSGVLSEWLKIVNKYL